MIFYKETKKVKESSCRILLKMVTYEDERVIFK